MSEQSEIDGIAEKCAKGISYLSMGLDINEAELRLIRAALIEYGDIVREECAKVLRDKAQELANDHMHTEYDTGAGVWDNKEAEWQAILLDECADEMTAIRNK